MSARRTDEPIYRIPPYFYIHVLDQNINVSRLEVGPKTYFCQDHEQIKFGPEKMITVPPRHYCVVENPVVKDAEGKVVFDPSGQVKLQHADLEIRLTQEPFPLYPGEVLKQGITALTVVPADTALRLRCVLDFEDETGEKRSTGDEWLFEGLGTYIPRKEVAVLETVKATVILPNQAVRLRARKECVDREDNPRVTCEEWIVKKTGAYLPGAYEDVVNVINAFVLSEKTALHMRALKTFKDDFDKVRKNGEEWLITMEDSETHIPNVYEEVVGVVNMTSLTKHQYCVILDPVDSKGRPQFGQKKLVKGEKTFFLMPGEMLEDGVQDAYIMAEDEGLVLRALEAFKDGDTEHCPGDRWMIRGPKEYVPPVQVEVVARRKTFPLDDNEGIYVRNLKTGRVRAISGETYMLREDEELWEKDLPPDVESVLAARRNLSTSSGFQARDKTRVVTYHVPFNDAVQIYDYKYKRSRVIFGPELVMLGPYEQFVQMRLSFISSCYHRMCNSVTDFFRWSLGRKAPEIEPAQ